MEKSIEIPQNTKNRTTIQSSNPNSEYLSEENENTNLKRYMHTYVHYSTIYNSQDVEGIIFLIAHPLVLLFKEPKY